MTTSACLLESAFGELLVINMFFSLHMSYCLFSGSMDCQPQDRSPLQRAKLSRKKMDLWKISKQTWKVGEIDSTWFMKFLRKHVEVSQVYPEGYGSH